MRTRWVVITSVVLAAVALGWSLRLHDPPVNEVRSGPAVEIETRSPPPVSNQDQTSAETLDGSDAPIDAADRARFNEQAREFFARAPALPPDEARHRADALSQELARIERAGGMSAGETFLVRAGLIRATEPDEQRQFAQIKALKERYEAESRNRSTLAGAHSDPMFELYKVRENEIVAEVMSLQSIPDGLSREEYLRRRLQAAREQLLGSPM